MQNYKWSIIATVLLGTIPHHVSPNAPEGKRLIPEFATNDVCDIASVENMAFDTYNFATTESPRPPTIRTPSHPLQTMISSRIARKSRNITETDDTISSNHTNQPIEGSIMASDVEEARSNLFEVEYFGKLLEAAKEVNDAISNADLIAKIVVNIDVPRIVDYVWYVIGSVVAWFHRQRVQQTEQPTT